MRLDLRLFTLLYCLDMKLAVVPVTVVLVVTISITTTILKCAILVVCSN